MPWTTITLNDGTKIPTIGYGTAGTGNGEGSVSNVKLAVDTGFAHVDTAQVYRNEREAGEAIRQYPRQQVYVTTKWSGVDGLSAEESIHNSLKKLGLSYVDLYLIHSPRVAQPDIGKAWAAMERIKEAGLARSIGVSNFNKKQLKEVLAHAKHVPAVNQIEFHPYVFSKHQETLAICAKHDIAIEGYSPLIPLTHKDGPVRPLASTIAEREGVTPEMVLLAWAKLKGAIVLTTSRKDWRLANYLRAGDVALTPVDEAAIDAAGAAEEVAVAQEKAAVKVNEKAVDEKAFLAALEAAELGGVDELVSCPSHTTRERKLRAATVTFKVLSLMCCAYMFWRM